MSCADDTTGRKFKSLIVLYRRHKSTTTKQDAAGSDVTATDDGAVSHVIQRFPLTYGQTLPQRAGAFPASRKLDTSEVFGEMQMKQSKSSGNLQIDATGNFGRDWWLHSSHAVSHHKCLLVSRSGSSLSGLAAVKPQIVPERQQQHALATMSFANSREGHISHRNFPTPAYDKIPPFFGILSASAEALTARRKANKSNQSDWPRTG